MVRILIADDMEQNRYMLEVLLAGHGYDVVSATNGEEAICIARSTPVDLIVTDILMPVKDGFTLCREWKADESLKHIPFIFYSATYTDQKDIDLGLSLGADRFLIKPMEPADLITAIEEVLNKSAAEDDTGKESLGESEYLLDYNKALVRKLEKKMLELESEINVRRDTEARLLMFKTAIENTDEAIIITDADGLIEYVNPAFEKTTGYLREEALGRRPEYFEGPSPEAGKAWSSIKSSETGRGRLTHKTKTGKIIELDATISPIPGESGGIGGYVSVMRDITRQIAMESHLAQSQKMEAIGTLAGGIAHDFNNILGAIAGYNQLALFESPEESKFTNYLNSALEACDRAKHLIEQILTFSRKTEQKKVLVELTPLIKESHKFLRALIPPTIDIRIQLEAKSGYIQADPVQVQQVILNLCTNAVYAMRDSGGVLDIILRRVELDSVTSRPYPELTPGLYFLLSFCDAGCGMDKETQSKIFEPFFTTKERGEGTGLGLAVAHGIVQAHNGTIAVYSELGHGSTFNVYFPEAEGVARGDEKRGPIHLPAGSEHILYVDDEQDLISIGSQMLGKLGYRVTTAFSGNEALSLFEKDPQAFDLVITDQIMRGMTGTNLAVLLKNMQPNIPIILCTGFSTQNLEEKAREIGIARLMTKPFDFGELAIAVRNILDGLKVENV